MMFRKKISFPILLEKIRNNYWVIPVIVISLMVLSLPLMLSLDRKFFSLTFSKSIFTGYSPDGARLILSSICTAVMTVIGVLFSITIVVIQQASAQFSPRIVEVFIKSRTSQIILGLYVGTFVYGILLLRQIPSGDAADVKIPQSAVSLGIIYALICIAFLVHYVHFISHLIRSTRIIGVVRDETLKYQREYAEFLRQSIRDEVQARDRFHTSEIRAKCSGYFQSFVAEKIDNILSSEDARVIIHRRIGSFVLEGAVLASITTKDTLSTKACKKLQEAFEVGTIRTHAQDIDYGVRQLVDIALRGLSPGINDPTTAEEALSAIGVILAEFADDFPRGRILELEHGTVIEAPVITLDELIRTAFAQILLFSDKHYNVLRKIQDILSELRIRTGLHEPAPILGLEETIRRLMGQDHFRGTVLPADERSQTTFS